MRKSERSAYDDNSDTHWIKVNALNTVYSFVLEEKCQGVEVFYAKDLEKIYLEILSEHGIQYESHTSRFASLVVSNNDDLEKRNIGSKITMFHCVRGYNFQRYDGSWHYNLLYERCCQPFT